MAEDEDGRPGQPYKSNHASKTAIKWHMVLKWRNVWFEGWDWFNKEDEFNSVRYVGRGTVGGLGTPATLSLNLISRSLNIVEHVTSFRFARETGRGLYCDHCPGILPM